jgi:DsbC/DsbD-like thiol-disulfide interchange protein
VPVAHRVRGVYVAGLAALLLASAARSSAAKAGGNVSVKLLSERAAVQPGQPFHVGLLMRMQDGWHTYWKNPGDSGLPLRITWTLPPGFSAGPIEWPVPERIQQEGLMSYGYTREVLLAVEITPPKALAADSVTLAGNFEWLECKDVCLPGSAVRSVSLPVRQGPPPPGDDAALFAKTRSRIPAEPNGWTFAASAGPRAVSLDFRGPQGLAASGAYLFVDHPLVADYVAPQGFERTASGHRVTLSPAPNASGTLYRLTGVLVVEKGSSTRHAAVRVDVPVSRGDPAPAPVQAAAPRAPLPPFVGVLAVAGLGLMIFLFRSIRGGRQKDRARPEPNR